MIVSMSAFAGIEVKYTTNTSHTRDDLNDMQYIALLRQHIGSCTPLLTFLGVEHKKIVGRLVKCKLITCNFFVNFARHPDSIPI